jgi:hypothetical protein
MIVLCEITHDNQAYTVSDIFGLNVKLKTSNYDRRLNVLTF